MHYLYGQSESCRSCDSQVLRALGYHSSVKVLRTFLRSGVPICKIEDFRDLFEDGYRLAG